MAVLDLRKNPEWRPGRFGHTIACLRETIPREDWQMDMLPLAFYVVVVLVVLAAGWFVMKPEKK